MPSLDTSRSSIVLTLGHRSSASYHISASCIISASCHSLNCKHLASILSRSLIRRSTASRWTSDRSPSSNLLRASSASLCLASSATLSSASVATPSRASAFFLLLVSPYRDSSTIYSLVLSSSLITTLFYKCPSATNLDLWCPSCLKFYTKWTLIFLYPTGARAYLPGSLKLSYLSTSTILFLLVSLHQVFPYLLSRSIASPNPQLTWYLYLLQGSVQ